MPRSPQSSPDERAAGADQSKTSPLPPRWLSIREACAFLGVDQSTLRRWTDEVGFPHF